jgi:phage tail sheath protein FI
MAFQVSPGVQFKEIDATNVVPAVSSSIGGFVGEFNWGPVNKITLVSSEDEMGSIFSTPTPANANHFLTAASFLKYGNALKVIRVVDSSAKNACTTESSATLIENEDDYLGSTLTGDWHARCPGVLGNGLKVLVVSSSTAYATSTFADYKGLFEGAPATSDYAVSQDGAGVNDELHVVVVDEDGLISGVKGTVLETFGFLSQALDAKDVNGSSLYYKEVINRESQWIWFGAGAAEHTRSGKTIAEVKLLASSSDPAIGAGVFQTSATVLVDSLSGGVDGTVAAAQVTAGLELFQDVDTVDVSLLFAIPDADGADVIGEKLISVCEARKDCMAFISPPVADTKGIASATAVTNVLAYKDSLTSSSYATLDGGAVYVYNKYHDQYEWIGASGLVAGLAVNTDQVADAWFSPAGVNRGQLRGITKLAYNPTAAQRDSLYVGKVNPIVSLPGQGTVLFGDKTLASRASAFDRINVRRLFIVLEKAISTAAKAQLFEFNDEFTRAQFRNLVEPFMRDVKGRRGVTDFKVVCDETNNNSAVVDGNRFVADIYVKPTRSINFITLNFVATRTGVEFSEVAGQ